MRSFHPSKSKPSRQTGWSRSARDIEGKWNNGTQVEWAKKRRLMDHGKNTWIPNRWTQKTDTQSEKIHIWNTTGSIASYLSDADLVAWAGVSTSQKASVEDHGPRQPYVKNCMKRRPSALDGPLAYNKGCDSLLENIVRLFASVAVMANKINVEEGTGVIRAIQFDIKDYTEVDIWPQTVFDTHLTPYWDVVDPGLWLRWDTQSERFGYELRYQTLRGTAGGIVEHEHHGWCSNKTELEKFIHDHWATWMSFDITDESDRPNRLWAPTIRFDLDDSLRLGTRMDDEMNTALKKGTGTLAQKYSFVTTKTMSDASNLSSTYYALFHYKILHQRGWHNTPERHRDSVRI